MPNYMYVHPAFGLLAVGLILVTFALNAGRRKHVALHTGAGLAAGVAGVVALVVALWAVGQLTLASGGLPNLPRITTLHLTVAIIGIVLLLIQVALGVGVRYARGGPPRFLRYHRRNGRLLAIISVAILVLGLATLAGIMI